MCYKVINLSFLPGSYVIGTYDIKYANNSLFILLNDVNFWFYDMGTEVTWAAVVRKYGQEDSFEKSGQTVHIWRDLFTY